MSIESEAAARLLESPDGGDWGSHLPILKAVLSQCGIRTVVEFGAGVYSTKAILGCPAVESLTSYEPDAKWVKGFSDPRLTMVHRPEIACVEQAQAGPNVDLVFVDSESVEGRLLAVSAMQPKARLVMLHDVEFESYRFALANFEFVRVWRRLKPWTGLATDEQAMAILMAGLKI